MKSTSRVLTWNHYLAGFIVVLSCGLLFIMIPESTNILQDGLTVMALALTVFCFFGQFETFLGAVLKVLSFVSIGSFIIYMTRELPDENLLSIIRIGTAVVVLLSVIAYFVFYYIKIRRADLIKNGWLLETTLEEIVRESSDNFQQYFLKSEGKNPVTGDVIKFKSQAVSQLVIDRVSVGDILKVHVDKKNQKRYHFDLSDYQDDSLFF